MKTTADLLDQLATQRDTTQAARLKELLRGERK